MKSSQADDGFLEAGLTRIANQIAAPVSCDFRLIRF
jgi:hypothetical protein